MYQKRLLSLKNIETVSLMWMQSWLEYIDFTKQMSQIYRVLRNLYQHFIWPKDLSVDRYEDFVVWNNWHKDCAKGRLV